MPVTYVTVVRFCAVRADVAPALWGGVASLPPEHTYDEYAPHAGVREAS